MITHEYPYTNFHELNLDWLLSRVENLDGATEEARKSAEEATAAAETSVANAGVSSQQADRAEAAANSASVSVGAVKGEIIKQGNDIAALSARMDTFARLDEGSTTGDAELADIRNGADGTEYPTAGDAVRGQITALKTNNSVDLLATTPRVNKTQSGITFEWAENTCHVSGTATGTAICDILGSATEMIPAAVAGESYYIKIASEKVAARFIYYTEPNGSAINLITTTQDAKITIPENAVACRIRLYVPSNAGDVNELVTLKLLNAESNAVLTGKIDALYNAQKPSFNLYDESAMRTSTTGGVTVTHNGDDTITLSTVSARTYAYVPIIPYALEPNEIYQIAIDVVECSATDVNGNSVTPNMQFRFLGDASAPSHLAHGITGIYSTGHYEAAIYTTGYESALRLYITAATALNSTFVVKNIMVAKYPRHIGFVPYGVTNNDVNARGLATSNARESWARSNFQAQVRQFATVKYTPINTLPSQFGDFPAGQEIMGVAYSSARENDRLVGMHISLYTFLSAIHNPRSVVYTRQLTYGNAKTYYGIVCSPFVNYVLGENINLTTAELWHWDKLRKIPFTAIEIGDILLRDDHVKIVYEVGRDEYGRIKTITCAEAGNPTVKWITRSWQQFINEDAEAFTPFRYIDRDNVGYTLQPMVKGYLDEVTEDVIYPDIMSEYGDRVAILEGENVNINVINNAGYSRIEVYRGDSLIDTKYLLADFVMNNIAAGKYTIKLIGTGKESTTQFIVVNANCTYDENTHILEYASNNATPHAVFVFRSAPENRFVPLTPEELAAGRVDLTPYVDSRFKYAKVNFMTEFGVATWYSYDLHHWRTYPD